MSPTPAPTDASRPWPALPLPVPPTGTGLRPWKAADAPALTAAWSDPAIRSWLAPPLADVDAAAAWIAGEASRRDRGLALDLVIDHQGSVAGEVGFSGFDAERRACLIGYWVGEPHRGQGLATAAVIASTSWLMPTLGLAAVVAQCAPDNLASHRVVEAGGFALLSAQHRGERVYVRRSEAVRPAP